MAKTLQNLRDALERRKKDLTDVGADVFVEWCNFIADFAYDHVKGDDPERFMDTAATYTVSADPQTSALPADFNDIIEWDAGFFEIDGNGDDTDKRLTRTGPGSDLQGYYISGSNVIFTGIEDSTQYRLRYLPARTEFTTLAEYFTLDGLVTGKVLVPDGKMRYLVSALDVLYTIWDEEKGDESFADARFTRELDQLLTHIRKEPNSYGMEDYSRSF